jgi:predicted DsbA family dithiol-disulfide isomerase
VGFTMNTSDSSRIYNTFDAHRLLAWAKIEGKQHARKQQLFILYFTEQADPGDHDALVAPQRRRGSDRWKLVKYFSLADTRMKYARRKNFGTAVGSAVCRQSLSTITI